MKAPAKSPQTYVGTFTEDYWGECRDADDNYCPECPVEEWDWPKCGSSPAIVIDGTVYFLNAYKDNYSWEEELAKMGFVIGEQIEVTGIMFEEYCFNYIDLVSVKKMSAAIENLEAADAVLDLQQPMYSPLGLPVDENYHGIVIQNGHKFVK